jgi:hypothetical protein
MQSRLLGETPWRPATQEPVFEPIHVPSEFWEFHSLPAIDQPISLDHGRAKANRSRTFDPVPPVPAQRDFPSSDAFIEHNVQERGSGGWG